jgi:DNA-binding CsgD family transcriptional regulator
LFHSRTKCAERAFNLGFHLLFATTNTIVGREPELGDVEAFLSALETGPAILLLEGEAGIGKSTLWVEGIAAASKLGYVCLTSRPIEAETQYAYAALGDLLGDVTDERLGELPDPQRQALEVALLRREPHGDESPQRAIAVAALGVLRSLASERPVVVAIDDAQWLDRPSAQALAFLGRRLGGERVGLFVTQRTGAAGAASLDLGRAQPDDGRVRSLRLGPLGDDDLGRLLGARLPEALSGRDIDELRQSSGGNPFYALEIGRAMLDRPRDAGEARSTPLPETLSGLVRDRLDVLSAQAREATEIAASLSRPDVGQVSALLGEDAAALATAECVRAGILVVEGSRIRFAHPLFASATYANISPARRRELHKRLAALTADAEERGRHLALGADGPDEAIAAALDEAAARARTRGAPDAAAELLERAHELTPAANGADARRRLVGSAERRFEAGDAQQALAILERAVEFSQGGTERARAMTRLGWVLCHVEGFRAGADAFETALAERPDDDALLVEIHEGIAWCAHYAAKLPDALVHARTALELAEQTNDPKLVAGALSCAAFLEALTGRGMPMAAIERAVGLGVSPDWFQILGRPDWVYGLLLQWDGRLEPAHALFETQYREATERGDEHSLPFVLFQLARIEILTGAWELARTHAHKALEVTKQTKQVGELAWSVLVEALVEAHLGLVEPARRHNDEGLEHSRRFGAHTPGCELLGVLGFLELSLGNLAEAERVLARLSEDVEVMELREPALFRFHGDLVETLVLLGRLDDAEAVLARLATTSESTWTSVITARGRGLLASAQGNLALAIAELERALELHDSLGQPFERARTLLVLGSTHRRAKRKRPARDALESALSSFIELGASLWAERASGELERIGGRRTVASTLTPTEQQIADLIAAGRTYRETADALFISPKTVQWNLSKIYRKLGIRSRAELPARLAAESSSVDHAN